MANGAKSGRGHCGGGGSLEGLEDLLCRVKWSIDT